MSETTYSLTVNGKKHSVRAHPMERLLDTLREDLKLTGTKEGCGEGECGACSVILDGKLVNSCLVPVAQAHRSTVITIEGIGEKTLTPIQQCFLDCGGTQCGICTPGMIVAATAYAKQGGQANSVSIREWLAGNLCRCTGYAQIIESVKKALQRKKR